MKIFLAVLLVAVTLAYEDPLRAVLRSPKATLKLYQDFKSKEHLSFGASEDRMRFRLFRKNAEFVASSNEVFEDTADYEMNFFSSMTEDEKSQYLGVNITGHEAHTPSSLRAPMDVPEETLWVKKGAVTAVKNQASCGSCWTFAAVGGLETRYQQLSGRLRSFAEQEFLDCTYPAYKNGCNGGWPDLAYEYSQKNGGRLAATVNYPYIAQGGPCKAASKPNDLVAYKITGHENIASNEQANIEALVSGSLSCAFEVTGKFQQYRGGILRDTTCTGSINHGVVMVGYTPSYVLVKNSWGDWWGDHGFVKFARHYHNCNLFNYASYPKLVATGKTDSGPDDKATDYTPSDDPTPAPTPDPQPDPDCKDDHSNCVQGYCTSDYFKDFCRKTCGLCTPCPPGTIRCPDNVCRHEHMC